MHVRYVVDADVSPGLLPRLLQPFAKRDLVPDRFSSHRTGDIMCVEIAMDAMPEDQIHLVEGNLRQIVGVRHLTRHTRERCPDTHLLARACA